MAAGYGSSSGRFEALKDTALVYALALMITGQFSI